MVLPPAAPLSVDGPADAAARSAALPRILVVDDHEVVRLGIRHLLAGRADLDEAADLPSARARLAATPFHLVLLDLGLGVDFGLTAIAELKAAHPGLRILVLTSMDEQLYAERVLRAGGDGYVMKSMLAGALVGAVEQVLAGQVYLSPAMNSALLRRITPSARPVSDERPALSNREVEVLRLVAAGLGTREIADRLNRSVKTIETHKQTLKVKLGADSPAMLVRLAIAWCDDAA